MKPLVRSVSVLVCLIFLAALIPTAAAAEGTGEHLLELSENVATLDGTAVPEYDYVWHVDPSKDHGAVKDSPAEYYTGEAPTGNDPVYISHDIYYYPRLDEGKFFQAAYDGETEWVYMYEAEGYESYIFSTLPVLRSGFPDYMMHTAEEAYQNPVLYITKPGTYRLRGTWNGQIRVDLGEDAFNNPEAKVVLILDGVDVQCTVAPGLVFAEVYECDNGWKERNTYSPYVDTSSAGACIIIADGTENSVSGTNIYRILRTKYKDENSKDAYPAQKKQLKVDGALYSYMSLNISGEKDGTGVLNIKSGFEGLDSELHLTINGGDIRIQADNDGININEDDVSVLTVTGGSLSVLAGLGDEGDGIDSNGFVLITGGRVITSANPASDSGLDSDCGTYIRGGTVVALGSAMDWAEAEEGKGSQAVMNLSFNGSHSAGEAIEITDPDGNILFSCIPGFEERTYSGMIVSAPELKVGSSCMLTVGGKPQCWSDSQQGGFRYRGGRPDEAGMGPGKGPGGDGQHDQPPGEMNPGQIPEGMEPGQIPEGMSPGQIPEGMEPGQMPGNMDPGRWQEGNMGPGGGFMGQGGKAGVSCTGEKIFRLTDTVNDFSSVSDFRHEIIAREDGQSYQCSACGSVFADAEGTILLEGPRSGPDLLLIIGIGALVLILGAGITAVILYRNKKK